MITGRQCSSASPLRSDGFTLVEALVALLVLSIGLLGIAALYVETLKAGRTALYRTEAVNFAADLADRMRANRNPAGLYDYTADDCADPADPGVAGNLPGGPVAAADLLQWFGTVCQALPGAAVDVEFTAGTPAAYDIQVSWTEVGQDDPVFYQLRVEI